MMDKRSSGTDAVLHSHAGPGLNRGEQPTPEHRTCVLASAPEPSALTVRISAQALLLLWPLPYSSYSNAIREPSRLQLVSPLSKGTS